MVKVVQSGRLVAMVIVLTVGFATLGYRLVDLQVFQCEHLRKEAIDNTHRTFLRESRRGDIRDRQGNLLAGTVFVKTVCASPELLGSYKGDVARLLAPLLQLSESELSEKLEPRTYVSQKGEVKIDPHVILKRKVALETWEQIRKEMSQFPGIDLKTLPVKDRTFLRNLRTGGIFVEPYDEQLRVYPNETLAAHVLGFVGSVERQTARGVVRELVGVDGIERISDAALRGVRGWRTTEVVHRREVVPFRDQDVQPHPGRHVILTLDVGLQHIVETELVEVMERHSPVSASAIAVRPATGEILAMANAPVFDVNHPGNAPIEILRNRAITDVAEPGSTFKIVAASAALNEGLVTLETQFDCEGGRFWYAGRSLRDDHPAGILTVEGIIAKSSNIGTAKIALQLGRERLYQYIRNFGFGAPTGIPLVGEVRGIVHPPKAWDKLSITRFPIGQGIAVTPLQMVMAMSAVANGGRLMQPWLIERIVDDEGRTIVQYQPQTIRQVISEAAAAQMVTALKTVVSTNGTAKRAKLEHYTVAGKTGTAQKAGKGGYVPEKYFASFVGFFPAANPELCIAVVVDEPKLPNYYGSQTAAPAFRNIAERAAKYLAIKPDVVSAESLRAHQSDHSFAVHKDRP